MPPIRVLVCDDSVVVRRIVTQIIDRDPDLEVCGTARDGADGLPAARSRPLVDAIVDDVGRAWLFPVEGTVDGAILRESA